MEILHLPWWTFCGILFSTIQLLFARFTLDQCPCPCPWQWHSQPPRLSSCNDSCRVHQHLNILAPPLPSTSSGSHTPGELPTCSGTCRIEFQNRFLKDLFLLYLFSSLPSLPSLPEWSHCFASPTTYGLSPNLIESRKPRLRAPISYFQPRIKFPTLQRSKPSRQWRHPSLEPGQTRR